MGDGEMKNDEMKDSEIKGTPCHSGISDPQGRRRIGPGPEIL